MNAYKTQPTRRMPANGPTKKAVMIDAKDLSMLTARLAQVLAEEVDLLKASKVSDIAKLQEEKLFLIDALEVHKTILKQRPELLDTIPSRDKHDLKQVVDIFEEILRENHQRLLVAKEINEQVVKAISEVVAEKSRKPYYGKHGVTESGVFEHHSVTLNQQV